MFGLSCYKSVSVVLYVSQTREERLCLGCMKVFTFFPNRKTLLALDVLWLDFFGLFAGKSVSEYCNLANVSGSMHLFPLAPTSSPHLLVFHLYPTSYRI